VQRSPRSRNTPANLSDPVYKRLNMYALAASAAGVTMSALAQPAEAKVVYTAVWVPILPSKSLVNLDLNNDGVVDFAFSNYTNAYDYLYGHLKILPQAGGNAVWGVSASASALKAGIKIGPSHSKFQSGHEMMGTMVAGSHGSGPRYSSEGPWTDKIRGYLGLKFMIQGKVHYGWARLTVVDTNRGMYAALSGYAYETKPNTPILTGQQSGARKAMRSATSGGPDVGRGSLGRLARGASKAPATQE
jgi:hypothetical protein